MILYTYRCVNCGREHLSDTRADALPFTPCCKDEGRRIWGFGMVKAMPEHWNATLGKPISTRQQFQDGLKAQSEHMSERLGFDQNYVEVDPTDRATLGVTDEGIGAKYDLKP